MKYQIWIALCIFPFAAHADLQKDQAAIRAHAGCYTVGFDYAETFPLQADYQTHAPYHEQAVELVILDQNDTHTLALQHILMTPAGPIKHWRQEWTYEPTSLFEFKGELLWEKRTVSPHERKGAWVQRVYQVDDSPRYECVASWVHQNGRHYWECETWAPLPRRERQRHDYNVVVRRNRQEITRTGWIHEEDNIKMNLQGAVQTPLVKEKGESPYARADASQCAEAQTWWDKNREAWHIIQDVWRANYAQRTHLQFKKSEDGPLWEKLFALAQEGASGKIDRTSLRAKAQALVDSSLAP